MVRIRGRVSLVYGLLVSAALLLFVFVNWVYPPISTKADSPYEAIERLESEQLFVQGRMNYIEEQLIKPNRESEFDVFRSANGFSSSPGTQVDGQIPLEEMKPFIKEYLDDGYKEERYTEALELYSLSFVKKGRVGEGIEVVEKYLSQFPKESEDYWEVYLYQAALYMYTDLDKAVEKVQKINEDEHEDLAPGLQSEALAIEVYNLMSHEKYEQAFNKLEDWKAPGAWMGRHQEYLAETRRNLKRWQEGETELHTISGQLTKEGGDPISYGVVYVKAKASLNSFSSMEHLSKPHAYTDESGNYTIPGVPTSPYGFVVGTTFDQTDGYAWTKQDRVYTIDTDREWNVELKKEIATREPIEYKNIKKGPVSFDWDPVEGAAYYHVTLSKHTEDGSTSSVFRTTDDDRLTVSMEELYGYLGGVGSYPPDEHEGRAIPKSLLAFANPNADFSWNVEAYGEGGVLLSSSQDLRSDDKYGENPPFFRLTERELTPADEALLEHNYEQAEKLYEQTYREEGDSHALRMWIRMKEYAQERRPEEPIRASFEKLPYLEEYAEMTDDPEAWAQVAWAAEREKEWDTYFDAISRYMSKAEYIDFHIKSSYAEALAKHGEYAEAEDLFEEAAQLGHDSAIRKWTALSIYLKDDFQDAKKIAETYPSYQESFDEMEYEDWSALITAVEKQVESDREEELMKEGLNEMFDPAGDFEGWLEEADVHGPLRSFFKDL